MDKKLIGKMEAALDAATAIFEEIENPTMNLRDNYLWAKEQMKAVKAARKALNAEKVS